jgi:hypothetical protein
VAAPAGVSEVGAPPANNSRNSACSWLTERVLLWDRLTRRSSRSARESVVVSGWTWRASPCSAATLAAAAASIRSFLRRLPRESSRTRAVAVVGMSRTTSPRASSHNAKWCPSPSAFSIAHVLSGHAFAQPIRRWYSASDASMRTDPTSELVAGFSAVAVWVDLCGSTPMTIMDTGSLSLVWAGIRGGQSGFKYLSQQLVVTPLFSHAANADRRDDTPQLGQPKARVTGFNRVIPCGLLRHAMGRNPTHRPVTLIRVGFNGVFGLTR